MGDNDSDELPTWSDVDDYGRPQLRRAWKLMQDDPPLNIAVEIEVPSSWEDGEMEVPE